MKYHTTATPKTAPASIEKIIFAIFRRGASLWHVADEHGRTLPASRPNAAPTTAPADIFKIVSIIDLLHTVFRGLNFECYYIIVGRFRFPATLYIIFYSQLSYFALLGISGPCCEYKRQADHG